MSEFEGHGRGLANNRPRMPEHADDSPAGSLQCSGYRRARKAAGFYPHPALFSFFSPDCSNPTAQEAYLESAVDRLLTNRTGILFAHPLSTVQRADRILILENGRIREQGDRNALASDPSSRYHHLLQLGEQGLET